MATKAQLEANRRNAQKSTGPKTPKGKSTVAQNALRHGLCAAMPLLANESPEQIEQLLLALFEENQPVGANEEILVYKMAEAFTFQKRASNLLASLTVSLSQTGDAKGFALALRYHAASDRSFNRALTELRKLQKDRKLQEIGFVSQTAEAAAEAPAEPAEPRAPRPPQPQPTPIATPAPVIPSPTDAPNLLYATA